MQKKYELNLEGTTLSLRNDFLTERSEAKS